MKLIYLKIENLKNIKNTELYFDRNHEIIFIKDNDIKNTQNKAYYLEIFNKEENNQKLNIFDCNIFFNAIVGENGAGKTNVLEAICNFNHNINSSDTLIFKIYRKNDEYYYWINDTEKAFHIRENEKSIKKDKVNNFELLTSSSTIFYSEIPSRNVIEYKQVKNISFWNEVQKIQLKYIQKHLNNNFNKNSIVYLDRDYEFNSNNDDILEQVSLNYSINKIKSEMQLNQLFLEKKLNFSPNIQKEIKKVVFETTNEKFVFANIFNAKELSSCMIDIIFNEYLDKEQGKLSEETLRINKPILQGLSDFLNDNLNIEVTEERSVDYNEIKKELKSPIYKDLIDYDFLNSKLKDIKHFEDEYKKFILKVKKDEEFEDLDNNVIVTKKEFCSEKFIESLFPFIKYGIFNLKWDVELSTGEESLMYFFSRLFQVLMKNPLTKDYIIVIDEIEAYLHPNWQKNFINSINKFLKLKFFEKYNFNIIMTTHSPFVLSDLEDENIIYLDKDKHGICQDKSKEITINTFGSNIHELLTHSFFMKDELPIGSFAKSKIEEVIELLNKNEDLNNDEDLLCIKIISIIGEPVLQKRLWTMYYSKLKTYKSKTKNDLLLIQKYLSKQIK